MSSLLKLVIKLRFPSMAPALLLLASWLHSAYRQGSFLRQQGRSECFLTPPVLPQEEAARFSNLYAPEHLIVNTEDAEEWLPLLDNAGSVFLGPYTPESVGDYASGTNHVLPT